MPSFQPWGLSAQASRLPPTPPEHRPTYPGPMDMISEKNYYPAQSERQARHGRSGRDFIDRYSHGSAYTAQHQMSAQSLTRMRQLQPPHEYGQATLQYSQLPVPRMHDNATTAPILPPIRAPVDTAASQYRVPVSKSQNQQKANRSKEDIPSGGVAAHLDYDMDLMAHFVAEMAQGIVSPAARPTPQFQKYVLQILSSTRLPSSTIVLGLFYLASRMKIVSGKGDDNYSSGTIYRMLTTCLLLGSKFLDDNTFQNRSWADVSSIPVGELNKMELDWLKGFDWSLHLPMYHETEGFYMWREHWRSYEEEAQLAKARESQKLTPIDTTIARVQQPPRQPLMSPEGPIPLQYQRSSQYDTQWVRPFISDYTPPSSGETTPKYYNDSNWSYAAPTYARQSWNSANTPIYGSHRSQSSSYPHTPSYGTGYSQSVWSNHGPSCTCSLCPKHHEHYFTHSTAYGIQSVAG